MLLIPSIENSSGKFFFIRDNGEEITVYRPNGSMVELTIEERNFILQEFKKHP